MNHGGNEGRLRHGDDDCMVTVATKPCWICGQPSEIDMPYTVWVDWNLKDIHIEKAWPEGSATDKQLLRSGIHPTCWNEEYPEDTGGN